MRTYRLLAWALILVGAGSVGADEIWFASHEFCGSATANVFDGGPPIHESGCVEPGDLFEQYVVNDTTQPGSLGARARATSESAVYPVDDYLFVPVRLFTAYIPSYFPEGDNTGGEAEADLHSIIEFTMPVDVLDWDYSLHIDDEPPFEGFSLVTVENVTRSQTLLTLSEHVNIHHTSLHGTTGDVVRITTEMYGVGSMGPGPKREYEGELEMMFRIKPGACMLSGTRSISLSGLETDYGEIGGLHHDAPFASSIEFVSIDSAVLHLVGHTTASDQTHWISGSLDGMPSNEFEVVPEGDEFTVDIPLPFAPSILDGTGVVGLTVTPPCCNETVTVDLAKLIVVGSWCWMTDAVECDEDNGIYAGDGSYCPDPLQVMGDFDGDGDVDIDDYEAFFTCARIPGEIPHEQCVAVFDFDDDDAITLLDFRQFQVAFTEAG